MFTTSPRASVEPDQQKEREDKAGGPKIPQAELLLGSRPPWVYAILILGFGLTAYGMYNIYELMTLWPKVIRDDLRQGIKYRNQSEFPRSIHYLKKAWEKAKSLPLDLFKPDPLLKTSGIAIVLAGVLEDDGKKEEAFDIYKEALWQLQSAYLDLPPDAPHPEMGMETLKLMTGPERMRAAAIAYKLGCMASDLGKLDEEEEKWLTCAVNAILMAVMEAPAGSGAENDREPNKAENLFIVAQDLRLPAWSRMHDLAAPFETLGAFYLKRGNKAYALPLYLQAVSILIPPPPMTTSPEDRCRGAELMGRISGAILTSDLPGGSLEAIAQATAWAQKGLDVVVATRQSHPTNKYDDCEMAYSTLLFNLAVIRQLSGEAAEAHKLYEASLKQSKAIGLNSLVGLAQEALQDLDSKLDAKSEEKT